MTIRSTGSGRKYFRIWIDNLLLIVATLSRYFPFAEARRLRYFDSITVVAGQALVSLGTLWKMLRGFLLLAVQTAAYGLAGRLSTEQQQAMARRFAEATATAVQRLGALRQDRLHVRTASKGLGRRAGWAGGRGGRPGTR